MNSPVLALALTRARLDYAAARDTPHEEQAWCHGMALTLVAHGLGPIMVTREGAMRLLSKMQQEVVP